jgi:hypothetical protein
MVFDLGARVRRLGGFRPWRTSQNESSPITLARPREDTPVAIMRVWFAMSEDRPIAAIAETKPEETPIPHAAVRAELQRILKSAEFRGSKRCQDFLSFVVEQTLTDGSHKLKERTIGIEVFGRSLTYDTNEDGMVRIKASEVRKRLTLYYAGTGKSSDLRLEIPLGAYVPTFSRCQLHEVDARLISGGESATHRKEPAPYPWRRIAWAAVVVAALGVVAFSFRLHRAPTLLDQFWEPVLRSPAPILLTAAYTPVYVPLTEDDTQPVLRGNFIRLDDQYVGGGDLVAASRISVMLNRTGHPYIVKVGSTAFQDLSSSPSILIGYSSTQWQEVTKDLRFFIDDSDRGMIRDFGKATDWYPRLTPDRHTNEDYAIISRSLNPQTHSILVLVTGCTQYGTEAAANLITNPELFAEALHGAPDGWQRKNLQLVLQIKVIANSPASPKLIATYYW